MPLNRFESGLFKTNEDITPQIRRISKTSVWWRTQTTSVLKTLRPCGAISLLALDVFPLNLARFLILKGTLFRKYRLIFAYWSLSKLEKYHGWIYSGGDAAHVYTSFSQPLIRRKQLGWGELTKHVRERTSEVSEQGAGETTVNRIRHDWESSTSV